MARDKDNKNGDRPRGQRGGPPRRGGPARGGSSGPARDRKPRDAKPRDAKSRGAESRDFKSRDFKSRDFKPRESGAGESRPRPSRFGGRDRPGEKRDFAAKGGAGQKRDFGGKRSPGAKRPYREGGAGEERAVGGKRESGERRGHGGGRGFGEKRDFSEKRRFGEKQSFGGGPKRDRAANARPRSDDRPARSAGRPERSEKPRGEWTERPRRQHYRSTESWGEGEARPRPRFGERRDEGHDNRRDKHRDEGRDERRGGRAAPPKRAFGDKRPIRDRAFPYERSEGGREDFRERKSSFHARKREGGRDIERLVAAREAKQGERIAKVVARAGLCSRREAEAWIVQGRVAINGRVINSPALDVTARDVITVDGAALPARERTRLFLYHKPRGLVTTHADPEGRPTVFDALSEDLPRLISVGRLDYNTEGLLLLTNDGGLARALELPATGWLRRYRVRAHGTVTQAELDRLRAGIEIDGVRYGAIEASLDRPQGANVWLTFAIREGKNREVRNVLAHLGLDVNRLIRVSYGPFQLGEIAEGAVEEVKTRVLREQLGDKLARLAGVDLVSPARTEESRGQRVAGEADEARAKPRRAGLIADRKGRRVLVERARDSRAETPSEEGDERPAPRRAPKRRYHGKREREPGAD